MIIQLIMDPTLSLLLSTLVFFWLAVLDYWREIYSCCCNDDSRLRAKNFYLVTEDYIYFVHNILIPLLYRSITAYSQILGFIYFLPRFFPWFIYLISWFRFSSSRYNSWKNLAEVYKVCQEKNSALKRQDVTPTDISRHFWLHEKSLRSKFELNCTSFRQKHQNTRYVRFIKRSERDPESPEEVWNKIELLKLIANLKNFTYLPPMDEFKQVGLFMHHELILPSVIVECVLNYACLDIQLTSMIVDDGLKMCLMFEECVYLFDNILDDEYSKLQKALQGWVSVSRPEIALLWPIYTTLFQRTELYTLCLENNLEMSIQQHCDACTFYKHSFNLAKLRERSSVW